MSTRGFTKEMVDFSISNNQYIFGSHSSIKQTPPTWTLSFGTHAYDQQGAFFQAVNIDYSPDHLAPRSIFASSSRN